MDEPERPPDTHFPLSKSAINRREGRPIESAPPPDSATKLRRFWNHKKRIIVGLLRRVILGALAHWENSKSRMNTFQQPPTGDKPDDVAASKSVARPKKFWTYAKWTFAGVLGFSVIAVGAVVGNFYNRSSAFRDVVHGFIQNPNVLETWTPKNQFPNPQQQHSLNVLVLGCDSDYSDIRPVVIKGTNGRSDTMLLAHFDFDKNTVKVLSIPRDTAVYIPRHRGLHKINAANAFGGPALAVETVKAVFGVQPDYFVRLNFDGFQQIVDKLGGVDVTVHKQLDYDDNWGNLHVHLKPGFQHLNGYKAMGYVRIRHTDNDFERQKRQQEFIMALKDRVKDPGTLLSLPEIVNAVTDNLKSSLNTNQMLTLVNFAHSLPPSSIQLSTMPADEGPSFVYIRVPESEKLLRDMFFDGVATTPLIRAPEKSSIAMGTRRGGSWRRRHRRGALELSVPKYDAGGPVIPNTDDMPPAGADMPGGDSKQPAGSSDAPGAGSGQKEPGKAGDTDTHTAGDGASKTDTPPKKDAPDTEPKKDSGGAKGAGGANGSQGGAVG